MLERFDEDRGQLVFLGAVLVFTVVTYLETRQFLRTSAIVPQIILALIGGSLTLIVVERLFGDELRARVGLDAQAPTDESDSEVGEQLEGLYDIDLRGVSVQMAWIVGYVVGVYYIGFFTVSAVFSVVYVLVNETSPMRKRIPMALTWTVLVLGLLYVLFLEFLQVSSVWRLGVLP
jgi:hypothetical protein